MFLFRGCGERRGQFAAAHNPCKTSDILNNWKWKVLNRTKQNGFNLKSNSRRTAHRVHGPIKREYKLHIIHGPIKREYKLHLIHGPIKRESKLHIVHGAIKIEYTLHLKSQTNQKRVQTTLTRKPIKREYKLHIIREPIKKEYRICTSLSTQINRIAADLELLLPPRVCMRNWDHVIPVCLKSIKYIFISLLWRWTWWSPVCLVWSWRS